MLRYVTRALAACASIANQRVLVGIPCITEQGFCGGRASLYNLNVFE